MDNVGYTTLSRQSGLMQEMQLVANNIANASTAGFRREGTMFAEYIDALGKDDESLSMTTPLVRRIDLSQGVLEVTGSPFDLALEGPGFFQVAAPQGQMLTRAGDFATNDAGELVNMDGHRVLDIGGTPIFVPPGGQMAVARDGTVSSDGIPLGQIGVVVPTDPMSLERMGNGLFTSNGVAPTDEARVMQGFVEKSNVNPVTEITRMIEVQHAYEQGAKFLEREDERIRAVITTLGR